MSHCEELINEPISVHHTPHELTHSRLADTANDKPGDTGDPQKPRRKICQHEECCPTGPNVAERWRKIDCVRGENRRGRSPL